VVVQISRNHGGHREHEYKQNGRGALRTCFRPPVLSVLMRYLSFSVVNANSANTSDKIQKRTMTFDSDQPSNSKW
jgi:hypothetical protein